MILFLISALTKDDFSVKGTTLFISGKGNITNKVVLAACDIKLIETIIIEEGPTSIDNLAFENMINLKSITIGPSIDNIRSSGFRGINTIEEIYVDENNPNFVTDEYMALYSTDMTALVKVPNTLSPDYQIPRTVTYIYDEAMARLQKINSIFFHKELTYIGYRCIWYPKRITEVTFEAGIKITELSCLGYIHITTVTIPKSVKVIKDAAFWRSYYVKSINFEPGSNLQTIEKNAFGYCYALASFTFPPKCTTIKSEAFSFCTSLLEITIPASITTFELGAFTNAPNIKTINFDPNNQNYTVIDNSILMSIDGSQTIYVVASVTSLYITESMSTIGQTALQSCENLTTINVDPNNRYFYSENGILYSKNKIKAIAAVGGIIRANIINDVTEIGPYCFSQCSKLQTVTLSSKLVTINILAFFNCTKLGKIEMPAPLTTIKSQAFYFCKNLATCKFLGDNLQTVETYAFLNTKLQSIEFSSKLKTVAHEAFGSLPSLSVIKFNPDCPLSVITYMSFFNNRATEILIPKNVERIEYKAFENSIKVINLTFANPSKLKSIDYNAFTYMLITELTLPKTLLTIGQNAFYGISTLKKLAFETGSKMTTFGPSCFRDCVLLEIVQVPSSITTLDPTTFIGCTNLLEINVPNDNPKYSSQFGIVYSISGERLVTCPGGITEATIKNTILVIGLNAFFGCSKLRSIVFEQGCKLEVMEEGTFASCTSLTSIDLPTSLQTVQRGAFEGCTALETISFPDNCAVNLDADSIFANCISLTTVRFGAFCALTIIGEHEFSCCYNLSTITIPANCTTIGAYAFENCTSLSSITYELNSKISVFGEGAFAGCVSLNDYYVPDVFVNITSECFGSAPNISRVFIEDNLRIIKIGSHAFSTFPLKEFIIGTNTTVDIIENNAFRGRQITSLTLNNLVKIEDHAFRDCFNLTTITFKDISVIGQYAFSGCNSLTTFKIPASCTSIGNSAFRDCSSLNSITFDPKTVVSTFGTFSFYGCESLLRIDIPASLVTIGANSFQNLKLQTVTFIGTSKLATIGDNAFNGCKSLNPFDFPNSLKTIGNNAFQNCIAFSTLKFTTSSLLSTIGNNAFNGCSNIKSLSFPPNLLTIGSSAFINLKNLASLTFMGTPKFTTFGASSFSGCSALKTFTIPSSCTQIDTNAFQNCIALTGIDNIGNSKVNLIGASAFSGCSALTSFEVPQTCTSLGKSAFQNCVKLDTLTFRRNSKLTSVGLNCFAGCNLLTSFAIPDSFTTLSAEVFGNAPKITKVIIPSSMKVSVIRSGTFQSIDLNSLVLESSVTIDEIEDNVFAGKKITNFNINNDISLGEGVFKDCSLLKSVSFNHIQRIGPMTFANCISIKSIKLDFRTTSSSSRRVKEVTSIPVSCFENCSKLESIEILGSVSVIETNAFKNCENLEFKRLNTITQIKDYAFYNCSSIELPPKIVNIGNFAFSGTAVIDNHERTKHYELMLPNSLKSFGKFSFVNTGITIVYYAGGNKLETPYNAFSPGTVARVTYNYNFGNLGGLPVYVFDGDNPDVFFITDVENPRAYYRLMANAVGGLLAFQVFIVM